MLYVQLLPQGLLPGVVDSHARRPHSQALLDTSRVPVDRKSSVCLICMKYRIIILIIIIISLGQLGLLLRLVRPVDRVAQTQCTRHEHSDLVLL